MYVNVDITEQRYFTMVYMTDKRDYNVQVSAKQK